MPKPTTAYIFANAIGRLRFGVTKDLGFELERLRDVAGWERAGCVWWKDYGSLAEANVWVKSFRRMGPRKRRALVEASNPDWQDISGVPPRVAVPAGSGVSIAPSTWAESSLHVLVMHGHELDDIEFEMMLEDEEDFGDGPGGVGAVRHGWPDFPTPRRGADAQAIPRAED